MQFWAPWTRKPRNGLLRTLCLRFAIPIYRSLHTPEPRNPQKVSKRRSRPSRPGVSKKVSKKSLKTDFVVFLTHFSGLLGLFRHFFEHLFETFWGFRVQSASGLLYMAAPIATLCGFQEVLRRPVRGFPCTGCTETLFCRATEGTLNTQTPERASKRTLSGSQKVLRRPVRGFPY